MPSLFSEHDLAASMAAEVSWANTTDRPGRTAPARAAFEQRFLDQADGDPVRAEHFRKAYFKGLALKSAKARARDGQRVSSNERRPPEIQNARGRHA